eukprot:TRINITY_DN70594_c0_g1_i1.p1 TRINITY_DN70594_c0_g1~~TRINITY_DN70594_c0_g1_i1.p1  ORF type:complete len:496 (+),score=151.41 TRINITY_DN70594_c0_g1_i1:77-1489(+)
MRPDQAGAPRGGFGQQPALLVFIDSVVMFALAVIIFARIRGAVDEVGIVLIGAATLARMCISHLGYSYDTTGLAAICVLTAAVCRPTFCGCLAVCAAKLEGFMRPIICRVLPPALVCWIYSASRDTYLWALGRAPVPPVGGFYHPVEVMGLKFRNDIGNAAGLDKDGSLLELSYRMGAGFAVVGTVLSRPHTGNNWLLGGFCPWVPLSQSRAGLNSLGLPSKGIDAACARIREFRRRFPKARDFPIGLSIMGHPADGGMLKLQGVVECVRKACAVADFIEVNESCPNVQWTPEDRQQLQSRLRDIAGVRDEACKGGKHVPMLVKFGSLPDPAKIISTLVALKIEGLALVNTQTDYPTWEVQLPSADRRIFRWYVAKHRGGFSGPPILSRSLEQVRAAVAALKQQKQQLTIIHCGGIETAYDVEQSREVAPLREWYTGLMHNIYARPINRVYSAVADAELHRARSTHRKDD